MEEIIKILINDFKKELHGDFVIIYKMVSQQERQAAWAEWMKKGIKFAEWKLAMAYFKNTILEGECIEQYTLFLKNNMK